MTEIALRRIAQGSGLFTDGDWIESPYITDSGVRLIQTGNIGIGSYREQGGRYVSQHTFEALRCTEVLPSDVLICRLADPVGRACLAPNLGVKMITSVDVAILRPDPSIADPRYLNYWCSSTVHLEFIGSIARGGTRQRVSREQLGTAAVRLPSLAEQRAIADYLDTETGRIDALITKKRRMIELLQERVGSIIFDGVTGRLTSSGVCTVSSGIDWLGSVPDHFGTPWLGAFHTAQLGKMLNAAAASGPEQYPYIKNTNVQWDSFDLEELPSMSFDAEDRRRCELRPGDLLVCEGGEVGRSAVWDLQSQIYFQKALHRVRPLTENVPRFLMYCLWAAANQNVFSVEGNQATIVHLTGEKLRSHRFPWPPLEEQKRIVSIIDSQRGRIDRAVMSMELQIERLAERRQALITAAVTGELAVSRVWHDLSRLAGAA